MAFRILPGSSPHSKLDGLKLMCLKNGQDLKRREAFLVNSRVVLNCFNFLRTDYCQGKFTGPQTNACMSRINVNSEE